MNDLISRLSEIRSIYNCFDEYEEPYYRALSEAIQLVSVQPERKRGKWELVGTTKLYEAGLYVDDELEEKCSLCGCHTFRYETQKKNNYCPNCGADMRHPDD